MVVFLPRGPHDDAGADPDREIMRFPGIGPVFFVTSFDSQLAGATQPAEMPDTCANRIQRRCVECLLGNERANTERTADIDPYIVTIAILRERLLDDNALVVPIARK